MSNEFKKFNVDELYRIDKNVYAYECPECKKLHYPAVLRCKKCGNRRYPEDEIELIWKKKNYNSWIKKPLTGNCVLLSFTRLWALPEGFTDKYVDFGVVEFENGIRAVGVLDVETPKLNMKLKATTDVIRQINGNNFYGFIFK